MYTNKHQEGYDFLASLKERFQSDERVKAAVQQYLATEITAIGSLPGFLEEYSFREGLYKAYSESFPEDRLEFSWISQNLVLFKHLKSVIYELLRSAPDEDACTKEENELVAEFVNIAQMLDQYI